MQVNLLLNQYLILFIKNQKAPVSENLKHEARVYFNQIFNLGADNVKN